MIAAATSTYGVADTEPRAGFTKDLLDAARDNPMSTALIGMGVLWMIMGDSKRSLFDGAKSAGRTAASTIGAGGQQVGAGLSSAAGTVADAANSTYATVAEHAADLGSTLGEAATRRLGDVKDGADELGSRVSSGIDAGKRKLGTSASPSFPTRGGGQAMDRAGDLIASLSQQFSDILDRQPLVVGAVGLAIGAGVAAALPRIAVEDSLIQPVSAFKERVKSEVSDAYAKGASEARAQGLTSEAASDALAGVKDKITDVVKGGRDEVSKS